MPTLTPTPPHKVQLALTAIGNPPLAILLNQQKGQIMAIPSFLTVKQFSQKHPAFPEGGLHHRIFYAKENGLLDSRALVRNGRRVLIDEEKFFDWLKGHVK